MSGRGRCPKIEGGHRSCEQIGMEQIVPSLHHRKEGWLRHRKISRSHKADAAGVVFLFVFIRKTTPASRSVDASRCFLNRSATPPCGDARRGLLVRFQFVHTFIDRPYSGKSRFACCSFCKAFYWCSAAGTGVAGTTVEAGATSFSVPFSENNQTLSPRGDAAKRLPAE